MYHLDVDNPSHKNRAKLAHDFPKLTPKSKFMVLSYNWPRAHCPEFVEVLLPLAKLPKKPEQATFGHSLCDLAFICMLDLKPEAVRPVILEDLQRAGPLLSLRVLEALPEKELPELDEVLLANLNSRGADLSKIPSIIERYASARILPQVISFYQERVQQGWMCSLQTAVLRYWLKHDRPAALQAIEKAVNFRLKTRCYTSVLAQTLRDSFDTDAEQLVRKFVDDPDPSVAASAKDLLAGHAAREKLNSP
jgi:hypothetical protein